MNTAAQPMSEAGRAKGARIGVMLCLLSMFTFAAQDGITKTLVRDLPVAQLVIVRYWVFLLFALCFLRIKGGVGNALKTAHPWLQMARSLLGVFEIVVFGLALRYLGLAETHAIYAVFPLLTMAMAAVLLRERLNLRQCLAGVIGFVGTLIILKPGMGVFSPASLIPLLAALMFACFSVLTRKISSADSFVQGLLGGGRVDGDRPAAMGEADSPASGADAGALGQRGDGPNVTGAGFDIHGGDNLAANQLFPAGVRFSAGCGVVRRGDGDYPGGGRAAGGAGGSIRSGADEARAGVFVRRPWVVHQAQMSPMVKPSVNGSSWSRA